MRLETYDYSIPNAYFITICTKDKQKILWDMEKFNPKTVADGYEQSVGAIINRPHALCPISCYGEMVETFIADIPNHYNNVIVDQYVIMANHIHMIIIIMPDENGRLLIAPTVSRVIKQLKSTVTKAAGIQMWQRSFFDHIIRGHDDYFEIRKYINENPYKWAYKTVYPD